MKAAFVAAAIAAAPLSVAQARPSATATTYVRMAGAFDQYEIQSGRLLLQTTHDARLRHFAAAMVTDHTRTMADLTAATRSAGLILPPPRPDAIGLRDVAALRAAGGGFRDRLYRRQQTAAHARALALHGGYAGDGTIASLKAVAGRMVPMVRHHLATLRAI